MSAKAKFFPTFRRTEKCHFFCRYAKINKFERDLTSLFLVESGSLIAQINRLDKRNQLTFSDFKYLDTFNVFPTSKSEYFSVCFFTSLKSFSFFKYVIINILFKVGLVFFLSSNLKTTKQRSHQSGRQNLLGCP